MKFPDFWGLFKIPWQFQVLQGLQVSVHPVVDIEKCMFQNKVVSVQPYHNWDVLTRFIANYSVTTEWMSKI